MVRKSSTKSLINSLGDKLKQHPLTWGSAMMSFCINRDYDEGIAWAGDWQHSSQGHGWALFYFAQLYWAKKDITQALEVNHLGVQDVEHDFHQVWLAVGYYLQQDTDQSISWNQQINHHSLNPYHQVIVNLLQMAYIAEDESLNNKQAIKEMRQLSQSMQYDKEELADDVFKFVSKSLFKRIMAARNGIGWKTQTLLIGV